MIPITDEDRLKLKVYREIQKNYRGSDFEEFSRLVRIRYEQAKYSANGNRFVAENLEEQLLVYAHTWLNTPENKRRAVDVSALKRIKSVKKCKGNDSVGIGYFRTYNDMKKSLGDLNNGVVYIEDQLEGEILEGSEGFVDNTLEGQLAQLALKHKAAYKFRKRKIDAQALAIIRRCASCRNNHELVRYYYRFYQEKTQEE